MKTKWSRGFTLVELIIVIIILGILAALAIPQFVTSTKDAQEATLRGNLAVLRNAINVYYHQHSATYPGALDTDGSGDPTSAGDNPDAFVDQLTIYTDRTGKTSATMDPANYPYGPYFMVGIPASPAVVSGATATAVNVTSDAGALSADGTPTTGWKYSKVTGKIIANNASYESW